MAAAAARRDAASASSVGAWELRHLHLSLRVAFAAAGAGRLRGTARLELRCARAGAGPLRLDAHPSLAVHRAALLPPPGTPPGTPPGEPLPVESRPFASYGRALHVALPGPLSAGQLLTLEIDYEAGEGPGVCWLTPEQTAGKQKPYMYTQGQAVLNRSFFPGFDTPSVKCTYSATVQVPEGFTAVMSATSWEKQDNNTFVFKMSQPIPSYLIALAVGDIVSAEVGPRSHVWAEPCLIEAAKKEYDGVIEEFLAVGEKLFGPYVWGRYDILFMPPSFPFGGMENPCLTFVTPCLLAGDRSLVDVIIHEISHSWFGNLVTNATWGEFWLNEGFTMYAQRRISTEVYGAWPCPATGCRVPVCGHAIADRTCAGPGSVCCGSVHPSKCCVWGRSLPCILEEVKSSSLQRPGGFVLQQNCLCSERWMELPQTRARDVGAAILPSLTFLLLLQLPRGADPGWPELPSGHTVTSSSSGSAYTCLEAATGRALLRQHMDNTGEDHPLNKLRVIIEPGVNPDDTYNETPYEKGYCFVSYLAHLVGNQSKFDTFLQAYVNRFKFQSITADDALGFFLEYFPKLKEKGVDSIPGFEFDRWLNTPGWPPFLPDLSPGEQLMKPADELAELWVADGLNMEAIEAVDITVWRTYQLVYFLDQVLQKSPLPEGNVERLSKMYPKISKAQNAELRLRWCQIVLKNNLEAEYSKVKDFLHSQIFWFPRECADRRYN
ncbi:aminopeptidase B isoform X2 [Accipiter gentilis]|uniref:aminopeptidase B isoform X2 n=1 Tax=Astur gentilis TaxID=8957 RepID=UPI002110AB78|nr:aminopeptidase B isoform X2 [Accipiter gentilis]